VGKEEQNKIEYKNLKTIHHRLGQEPVIRTMQEQLSMHRGHREKTFIVNCAPAAQLTK